MGLCSPSYGTPLNTGVEQIVGRERRGPVSHDDWSGNAFVKSRRRVNSTVVRLVPKIMNRIAPFVLTATLVGHFGCASQSAYLPRRPDTAPVAAPSPSPVSSGSIAAALIPFEQPKPPLTIDTLLAELQKRLPYKCSRTQWVGFTTVIPQIRIDTPTPIFLQFSDDPETVREETQEDLADAQKAFGPAVATKIARSRVRLEVMGPDIGDTTIKDKSIEVNAVTQLDPGIAPAKDVLKIVADTVHGYVFDCVNGKWQYAAP